MTTSKLQTSLNNIHSKLKLENMSCLAKYARIKYLDDIVIKLGLDPNDVNVTQEIIKNKNAYIQALRKQLKFPTTEHPQAQEVRQLEN